jgi:hypothetical protein
VPTGLIASVISSSQINLSWSASTDAVGVTGYRIYRDGTPIAVSTVNSFSDTALSANTRYSYTVSATDAAGNPSVQSAAVAATTQAAPIVVPPAGGSSGGGSSSNSSGNSSPGSANPAPAQTPQSATGNSSATPSTAGQSQNAAANSASITSLAGATAYVVEQVTDSEAKNIFKINSFITLSSSEASAYSSVIASAGLVEQSVKQMIANFIHSGTPTTIILGSGERAGVIGSYRSAFGRLPLIVADWQDVIKIANGRWTTEKSPSAEAIAKQTFRKIYLRDPNMAQANDNAAVNIMAYGLRPTRRNLASEKIAILSFRFIFKKNPVSSAEWDAVRAIAYSGAKR